jgi:hypothetical protein
MMTRKYGKGCDMNDELLILSGARWTLSRTSKHTGTCTYKHTQARAHNHKHTHSHIHAHREQSRAVRCAAKGHAYAFVFAHIERARCGGYFQLRAGIYDHTGEVHDIIGIYQAQARLHVCLVKHICLVSHICLVTHTCTFAL